MPEDSLFDLVDGFGHVIDLVVGCSSSGHACELTSVLVAPGGLVKQPILFVSFMRGEELLVVWVNFGGAFDSFLGDGFEASAVE